MDNSMYHRDVQLTRTYACPSHRDVHYSCGTCGYELNLSSSNRNTSSIGSKYSKFIKRGIMSFFNIDDSRFTQVDEIQCLPYFTRHSWGLFRRRTKLLCRKCGNHIGNSHNGFASSSGDSSPITNSSNETKYDIRIRALQPSYFE
ncbi:unnamed protein product [Lupinus luteus]|uniref:Uncharacterized protein n=1 Tax=Lupinus luteus TaxID=3873 RepID=A0AAV1WFI1_LUPLU